ncbi:unnamed protein product [Notodromas monacha]|uniref:Ku70/Ku80 N-terminal alpha/beta domain-containing protein n=1 Tax=Notodromas monacha TaxID=399045 RepID=A0A7R9GFN2_9CRUS|nr:unnamed protein product [Notodromas monacha]CAG0919060.1 unnamed protein product [Notodromas monacha]
MDPLVEDDAEESSPWPTFQGRDALIYLIDASPKMFEKSAEENCSRIEMCLKCVGSALKDRIISSGQDLVGIVFFASEKQNQQEFSHITVCQELTMVSADFIKSVEAALGKS